jgi:hypothetical protein
VGTLILEGAAISVEFVAVSLPPERHISGELLDSAGALEILPVGCPKLHAFCDVSVVLEAEHQSDLPLSPVLLSPNSGDCLPSAVGDSVLKLA